jgi:cytochrome c peroxidase
LRSPIGSLVYDLRDRTLRGFLSYTALRRVLITKRKADIAAFKTPNLRNALVTEPYFHGGSQETREDARVPFDAGRRMAAGLPGARFVTLQGRNHLFRETESAFGQFLEQTRLFPAS